MEHVNRVCSHGISPGPVQYQSSTESTQAHLFSCFYQLSIHRMYEQFQSALLEPKRTRPGVHTIPVQSGTGMVPLLHLRVSNTLNSQSILPTTKKKLVVLPYYSAISKELQRIFLQTWGGGLFHSWCKSRINRNSKIQTTWRVTFFIFGHSSFLSWDSERDFECRKEILNLSRIFQNVQTCLYINALGRVQVG